LILFLLKFNWLVLKVVLPVGIYNKIFKNFNFNLINNTYI
jgi:hypothetical protein